ncbi:protein kinase domain-containing protein [Citrus sinensis]|uniref:Protein kinase domain-containing protein n=1 Tax=Citrus sinensis TaxID=2711 RepID=A0ACB8NCJ2_CITSI|nr:protein kinase domain-containing protein [Citrus sinensis]
MERNLGKGMMDQQKNYEQVRYSNVETRNEGPGSANQRFFHDPSSNINTNIRPPDYSMSGGVRPVLNYSIQTGEEFALEFMRERVIPRQHFVPNAYGDPNNSPVYMDLKGVLGISHTGSESGSDITMLNAAETGRAQELERKGPSGHEDRSYYDSMRSVPRTSSRNDMGRGTQGYASSGASDSSRKVKFLCSFGGKILPRPSDGKLRYVGGETRIIRISRDISWQELTQKALAIYNQTHTIKYQLPGEDLDALVSVSCDEDLQNMMEECNVLEDRGTQKPRMFLFSSADLEDTQLSLESMEGDSEIQYVVAVNCMDLGSRKNSIALASASENNLDELLGLRVEREAGHIAAELAGSGATNLAYNASSSTIQSSQPVLLNQQGGLAEEKMYSGFHADDSEACAQEVKQKIDSLADKIKESEKIRSLDKEASTKEQKIKRDHSLPKINEIDNIRRSENDHVVSSHSYVSSVSNYIPREEVSVVSSSPGIVPSLLPSKSNKMAQEPIQNSMPLEAVNEGRKNNDDDVRFQASGGAFTSGHGDSEAEPTNFSYNGPSAIPQRYHSEQIPREQTEKNRLSKSDDSFGSQFLISQALSDGSKPIRESVDKLHSGNMASETEQSVAPAKQQYTNLQKVEDGHAQLRKHKEFADKINKINSNGSEDGLRSSLGKSELTQVVPKSADDCEVTKIRETVKDLSINDEEAAGLYHPTANHGTSGKKPEDSSLKQSEYEWNEIAAIKNNGNDNKGQAQSLAQKENSVRAVSPGDSSIAVVSPEGDILIDINDRFPRDFLSDIFTKARISENIAGVSPMHGDGAVLSWNVENHDPRRWSYFRNLAQDEFSRKDVSLMDQDHLGFSSPLTNIEEGATVDYSYPPLKPDGSVMPQSGSRINFDEGSQRESSSIVGPSTMETHPDYSRSELKGNESLQSEVVNHRIQESDYEEGRLDLPTAGIPLVDLALGNFDISTLQIIKNEDLEELKELGSGTFGTVYHGKWRGTDVAIKRIKKSCFTGRSSEQERLTLEFWREAEILSKLHHPNVVAFYGVVQDGPGGTLATVTEFMVNGSLRHVLLSKERHLDRRKRLIIAMDAAFGMEYLHSKNIVHFDLKCDNLLVNLKDPIRPICKVGDFGLSKIKRNTLVTGGVRGTLPWMAPELLNGSSSKVSEKVDVFSFGIVLWEILTGEEPYANMHYGAIIGGIVNNTLRPPVPGYCDSEWRLLMEQCWAPDPVVRPSFTEIARRLRVMSAACQTKSHGHQVQNQVPK